MRFPSLAARCAHEERLRICDTGSASYKKVVSNFMVHFCTSSSNFSSSSPSGIVLPGSSTSRHSSIVCKSGANFAALSSPSQSTGLKRTVSFLTARRYKYRAASRCLVLFAFSKSSVFRAAEISSERSPGPATRIVGLTSALCFKHDAQLQPQSPLCSALQERTRANSKAAVSLPEAAGPEKSNDPGSV